MCAQKPYSNLTPTTWRLTFSEDISSLATREALQYVFTPLVLSSTELDESSLAQLFPAFFERSFDYTFLNETKLIGTLVAYKECNDQVWPAIKHGLFLDLIFNCIICLEDILFDFEQINFSEQVHYDLYQTLSSARKKRSIMFERILRPRRTKACWDQYHLVKICASDEPHMNFFYGDRHNFCPPEFHRQNASNITKYSFAELAHPCPSEFTEAQIWTNFFWRELYWGINLAAFLSCDCCKTNVPSDKSTIGKSSDTTTSDLNIIDVHHPTPPSLNNEENDDYQSLFSSSLITTLMSFPFPSCRMIYIQSALQQYASSPLYNTNPSPLQFESFLRNHYLLSFLSDRTAQTKSYSIDLKGNEGNTIVETKISLAFCLIVATEIKLLDFARNSASSLDEPLSREQIETWLTDKSHLKTLQDKLCALLRKELCPLCGISSPDSFDEFQCRWPLFLLGQTDQHIESLLKSKSLNERARNKAARAYASQQARCYNSVYIPACLTEIK